MRREGAAGGGSSRLQETDAARAHSFELYLPLLTPFSLWGLSQS